MKQFKHSVEDSATSESSVVSHAHIDAPTLVDFGARRLEALCIAAGFESATADVVSTFRALLSPWGDMSLHHHTEWVSDISDDNTPIELSAAIAGGEVEVRVLLEAQAEEPTLRAYRAAALELTERLEREHGADLSRFRKVQDLFLPDEMNGPFALWHSAVFRRGRPPAFKAYFNPQAHGRGRAQALVEEALGRLGFDRAWGSLCRTARRGPHLDELKYFALDLVEDPKSRVKVYVRHHDATAADLEEACSAAESYTPGEVHEFVRAMGGDRERLAARATFTCSALIEGSMRPAATTVYVPICAYAPDDLVVQQRVHDYLEAHGMSPRAYDTLVRGYAERPLDAGVGMQSWVAFRRHHDDPRLTVYLATEAAKVHERGSIPAATGDRLAFVNAEAVVRAVTEYDLGEHPLVQRLAREPDSTGTLWKLLHGVHVSVSTHHVRWLAELIARVEDDALRSLLARQLDLELGEGDFVRSPAHRRPAVLDALARLRPVEIDADAEHARASALARQLAAAHDARDALEGLGAGIAAAIGTRQILDATTWIVARHAPGVDVLTLGPTAYDSAGNARALALEMAGLVPTTRATAAAFRDGAMAVHASLWHWLDGLYVECFGERPTGEQ